MLTVAILKDHFGSCVCDGFGQGWEWVQARDECRKTS